MSAKLSWLTEIFKYCYREKAMRDIETNMVRISINQCTDSEFFTICQTETSETIPELRQGMPAHKRTSPTWSVNGITRDTQYVEVIGLGSNTKLTTKGLVEAINALPDRVHTIVFSGNALRTFCDCRVRRQGTKPFSSLAQASLFQAKHLVAQIRRRIEFIDSCDFTIELKKSIEVRKQETIKAVSAMADYASDYSEGIKDANVGSIVMAYRDF